MACFFCPAEKNCGETVQKMEIVAESALQEGVEMKSEIVNIL